MNQFILSPSQSPSPLTELSVYEVADKLLLGILQHLHTHRLMLLGMFVLYGWGIEHHDGEYQVNKNRAAPTM
jgi:hypothetical protein